jgi:hypothetical protein
LSVVRQYDDFARSFCGLPTVAEGLDVLPEPQAFEDGEVLIPVGPGQPDGRARDAGGRGADRARRHGRAAGPERAVVPLPLGIPGRYLVD